MKGDSGGPVDPAARDKYLLRVTAGPSYDAASHTEVAVNSLEAHPIENDLMTCFLKVRIRDYHGLPQGSPPSSDYFSHPLHTSDRYSIGFSFVPKRDIRGSDLVTGFDFDHSIKDRLPPGFRYAMKIVTTILDPGIYSDPYSDKPYLYGPALSSFFSFRIGEQTSEMSAEEQLKVHDADHQGVIEEGAEGSGQRVRADHQIPAKSSKRRKNFLDAKKTEDFVFEAGRLYQADFFNPYLDFANFALRIPGFSISVVRYIDDKTHALRYVLKNRATDEVLFVVIFNLLFGHELQAAMDDGKEHEEAAGRKGAENEMAIEGRQGSRQLSVDHPETSSSGETPTPSSRSITSSASESDVEGGERQTRQERATAASTLANSIYSSFAALGFGRGQSSSSSEATSKDASPARPQAERQTLNQQVDAMDEGQVAQFLQAKTSNV